MSNITKYHLSQLKKTF
jgi:multisite-specific tRNA:(cytosine-C5)-methyltransferase